MLSVVPGNISVLLIHRFHQQTQDAGSSEPVYSVGRSPEAPLSLPTSQTPVLVPELSGVSEREQKSEEPKWGGGGWKSSGVCWRDSQAPRRRKEQETEEQGDAPHKHKGTVWILFNP